jgi:hypothetical protein
MCPPPCSACPPRERLGKGEEVEDDLSDLGNPDLLAELAQSHKLAEAAAAAAADEHDDDPYGAGQLHESGGCMGVLVLVTNVCVNPLVLLWGQVVGGRLGHSSLLRPARFSARLRGPCPLHRRRV